MTQLLARAKMTVVGTPGTGAITLGTAYSDGQTFAAAGLSDGQRITYVIFDGANFENGQGTYTAATPSLSRDTVSTSSSDNAKISLTSAAIVYATAIVTGTLNPYRGVLQGNLDFSGIGLRITGDLSNATIPSRLSFQTDTANSKTALGLLPTGTSTTSEFNAESDPAATNGNVARLAIIGTEARISNFQRGTANAGPLTFYTSGVESARIAAGTTTLNGIASSDTLLQVGAVTTGFRSLLNFASVGVNKWQLGRLTDDSFALYDIAGSANFLTAATGGVLSAPRGLTTLAPNPGDNTTRVPTTAYLVNNYAPLTGATFTGAVTATSFTGSGAGLTGITASQAGAAALTGAAFTGAISGTSASFSGAVGGASGAFTGAVTTATPATADNSTTVATTAFVKAQAYAPLASPTFTGTVAAPTPTTADNSTAVATTAFVKAQAYAPLAGPTFTGLVNVGYAGPVLRWTDTGGATDGKIWEAAVGSNQLLFRILNDAASVTGANWLTVLRNGNAVSSITFSNDITANGASLGNTVTAGFYQNPGDVGVRAGSGTGSFFVQGPGGTVNWATFKSTGLGIGTVSPGEKLTVSVNASVLPTAPTNTLARIANVDASTTRLVIDSFAGASQVVLQRANTTALAPSALALNDSIGGIVAFGRAATAYTTTGRAAMGFWAAEAWTDLAQGAYITWNTTPTGAVASAERLRLDAAGNLGVGMTPTYKLDVTGDIRLSGRLYAGPSLNTYGSVTVQGVTTGYAGINFANAAGTNVGTLMVADSATNRTVGYLNGTGAWDWSFFNGALNNGSVPASLVTTGTFGAGAYTFPGNVTLSASGAGIETGSVSAVNTPFIDFHSSGNNIDYDARIIASGGTASVGAGTLTFTCATAAFSTNVTATQLTLNATARCSGNQIYMLNNGAFYLQSSGSGSVISCGGGGYFAVGNVTPTYNLHVYGACQASYGMTDAGNKGGAIYLQDSAAGVNNGGAILFGANQGVLASIKGAMQNGSGPIGFLTFSVRRSSTDTALTTVLYIDTGGHVNCGTDGGYNLGMPTQRFAGVYATSGTVSTSDAREKTPIYGLQDAELRAGGRMLDEIGSYQFLKSIEEKGAAARHHIGLTVQRAIEIFDEEGLDGMRYGLICYDKDEKTGKDHYGFRNDQSLLLMVRALSEKNKILSERIASLEDRTLS